MRHCYLLLVIAGSILGCAQESVPRKSAGEKKADRSAGASAKSAAETEVKSSEKTPSADAIRRKIIYRATVDLVVEDFQPVPAGIASLVKQFGAYLARSNISGTPGAPRTGNWTFRVPADSYDAFLEASLKLGEVRRISSDSQDVTEEFYDVEARIRNKKQEETRLLKLLDTATGKLDEVLAVEREIARVRGEVEQLEGRVRVLSDLTTLTTVELVVTEIKDYIPEEAATYATRVRRTFQASMKAVVATGVQLSIAAVALAPWAVVLLVPALPLALWLRRRRRRGCRLTPPRA